DIDLLTVGGQAANVAVRRVAARRDPIEPETARVLIELVGHPAEVAEVIPLEMRLDGILQESAAEPSDPGGRLARIVAATDAASGTFSVLAPSDDVLQADNRRDAQIPPAELLTVGSVGPLGGALNVALRADRRVRYLEAGGMPSAGTDGLAGAAGTILIVRGDVPTTLPPGPMLVVAPAAGCDLFEIEGTIARAVIGEQDITSSIVAGLDLEGIALSDVARLKLPTRAARDLRIVAASAEGEPLLVAFDRAEGRVVVLLGDTDASELSHHAEFPRLLSQVLQWLAEMEERSEPEHDGRERDIFSAGESDLRVPAKVGTPADSWRMPASRPPAWLLLGALSITLLLVEWRLYHRRWIS
ncbi:MAG: hypothetical protein U1E05_26295, partial [Patescibacteria group bacterium]|nr:hypothetical protein [Patescibacteria group bacterium]